MYLCDKPRSLVEQKKIQWAKEREELAKLSVPWGRQMKNYEKNGRIRNQQKSSENYYNQEETYTKNLPPIIQKNRNEKYQEYDRYEVEGDTSGYASESAKSGGDQSGTPDHHPSEKQDYQIWSNWHRSSESENSSGREDRPKWGDRGLGVGHLWDPREMGDGSKPVEPPGWMQRGLRRDKEVLVVSQSPDQSDLDRPFTSDSNLTNHTNNTNNTSRTHLRGQNVPLEPVELMERERKRQKALELQNAIKQQLEEKELKKKQDRERKLREEAEEEDRIRKEQEQEKRRVEEEERLLKEKKEKEKQRTQAMHEALQNAEKEAKEKKRSKKLVKSKAVENSIVIEEIKEAPIKKIEHSPVHKPVKMEEKVEKIKTPLPIEEPKKETPRHIETTDPQPKPDNLDALTLVLPNNFDNLQNMQFALLLPSNSLPENLPMSVALPTDRSFMTENRVLTPSVYRNKKNCRETSTQTDGELQKYSEKYTRDNSLGSLDRNRGRNRTERKEKRFRSEDRSKENRSDKPKWGVNRPPTRYMKQSEKDPIYQKRKLRQKTREIQLIYEDKNNNYSQSSEDTSTPVTPEHKYRKNRGQWHKNERMFAQNISVYQTEILPLDFDRTGRMYVKDTDYSDNDKHYRQKSRTRYKTPDIYAVERASPKYDYDRNEHRKMTDREYDSERTDNEEVLEKLNSLHKGLMIKQRQWENNGRRSTFPNV